jgi:hypothetical protein
LSLLQRLFRLDPGRTGEQTNEVSVGWAILVVAVVAVVAVGLSQIAECSRPGNAKFVVIGIPKQQFLISFTTSSFQVVYEHTSCSGNIAGEVPSAVFHFLTMVTRLF